MPVQTARHVAGTFCWVELNAQDPDAARAYYARLLGWEADVLPTPDGGSYTLFTVGGRKVAALQGAGPEEGSHWTSYLAVDDVDAAAARAEALGGRVLAPPFDVFDAGRAACLADPTGAVFALWQGGTMPGSELAPGELGGLCWHDLYVPDMDAAATFYAGLFGYDVDRFDVQGMPFAVFRVKALGEDGQIAGMCNPGGGGPAWRPFFAVADVDAAVALASELGSQIACPPTDMGDRRFAHVVDPQGVGFGVFQLPR